MSRRVGALQMWAYLLVVRLLVVDEVHFVLLASLTFHINNGRRESLLRFEYQGKWSPYVCESLNTKGETITLIPLLYVLISH